MLPFSLVYIQKETAEREDNKKKKEKGSRGVGGGGGGRRRRRRSNVARAWHMARGRLLWWVRTAHCAACCVQVVCVCIMFVYLNQFVKFISV